MWDLGNGDIQGFIQGLDLAQDLVQGLDLVQDVVRGLDLRTWSRSRIEDQEPDILHENHGILFEMGAYGSK